MAGIMTLILGSNLSDKPVMRADGTELGSLHQVTVNLETGQLADIIVAPDANHALEFPRTDEGHYKISIDHILGIHDYVIIE